MKPLALVLLLALAGCRVATAPVSKVAAARTQLPASRAVDILWAEARVAEFGPGLDLAFKIRGPTPHRLFFYVSMDDPGRCRSFPGCRLDYFVAAGLDETGTPRGTLEWVSSAGRGPYLNDIAWWPGDTIRAYIPIGDPSWELDLEISGDEDEETSAPVTMVQPGEPIVRRPRRFTSQLSRGTVETRP